MLFLVHLREYLLRLQLKLFVSFGVIDNRLLICALSGFRVFPLHQSIGADCIGEVDAGFPRVWADVLNVFVDMVNCLPALDF